MVHTLPDVTAVTGTNVAIYTIDATHPLINATWVRITSPSGNAASRVGDANITSTRGQIINASGEAFFPPSGNTAQYNLAAIFINGTSSQSFGISYGTV